MRISISIKVFGLVLLGVLTSFAVSKVLDQRVGAQSNPAAAPQPQGTVSVAADPEEFDPVAFEALRRQPLPANVIAMSQINKLTVQATGRSVSVSAATRIREKRPNCNFVWGLLLHDPDGKFVDMRVYDTQVFSMPQDTIDLWPTFDEVITLPPGSYKVQLVLYLIPPGFDPHTLKTDEKLEAKYRQACGTQPVTVEDNADNMN